ncbi:MAG TPA: sialidase family protein, partial [Ignavibacteriaceae bacterium]|nr:sialidase family protein [Ignavibacteriaceae bacterium]
WVFGKHVYVNYSDNEGKTFSNPVKVNKEPQEITSNGENRPKVIFAKNGNIYVSYSISLKEKYTGLVKFSRSIDGGKTLSEPVTINDDTAVAGHGFESLGVSEDGTIYLFWLDSRLSRISTKEGKEYNGSSIFYTYSEDNGKTFKPNKKIADHVCQCCRIALDFDKNFPVIIYRDVIDDNIRDHSLIKFANKESFTKPKRVTFENWKIDGCPHHGPSFHIDNEGIYHLTWFNMEEYKGKIFYARSDNKGESFEYKKRIGGKTVSHPFIQGNKNILIITWLEFNEKNNSAKKTVSADGGKTWKDEEEIFSFKEYGDHPFLIKKKNEIFSTGKSAHEIYLTSLD